MKSIDYSSLYGDDEFDDQLDKNFYSASISPRDYISNHSSRPLMPRNVSLEEFNTDEFSDSDYEGRLEIEEDEEEGEGEGEVEGEGVVGEEGDVILESDEDEEIFLCEDIPTPKQRGTTTPTTTTTTTTSNKHKKEANGGEAVESSPVCNGDAAWKEVTGAVQLRKDLTENNRSGSPNHHSPLKSSPVSSPSPANGHRVVEAPTKAEDIDTSSPSSRSSNGSQVDKCVTANGHVVTGVESPVVPAAVGRVAEKPARSASFNSLECEEHWYFGNNNNSATCDGDQVERNGGAGGEEQKGVREGLHLPIPGPTSLKGLSGLRSLDELNVQISICGSLLLKSTQNAQVVLSLSLSLSYIYLCISFYPNNTGCARDF